MRPPLTTRSARHGPTCWRAIARRAWFDGDPGIRRRRSPRTAGSSTPPRATPTPGTVSASWPRPARPRRRGGRGVGPVAALRSGPRQTRHSQPRRAARGRPARRSRGSGTATSRRWSAPHRPDRARRGASTCSPPWPPPAAPDDARGTSGAGRGGAAPPCPMRRSSRGVCCTTGRPRRRSPAFDRGGRRRSSDRPSPFDGLHWLPRRRLARLDRIPRPLDGLRTRDRATRRSTARRTSAWRRSLHAANRDDEAVATVERLVRAVPTPPGYAAAVRLCDGARRPRRAAQLRAEARQRFGRRAGRGFRLLSRLTAASRAISGRQRRASTRRCASSIIRSMFGVRGSRSLAVRQLASASS